MASMFKVWIEVEEVDHERDIYENDPVPEEAGVFATEEEARAFQRRLMQFAGSEDKCDACGDPTDEAAINTPSGLHLCPQCFEHS